MGKVIDGKSIAGGLRRQLKQRTKHYKERTGRAPGLGVILVGDDPASAVYVRNKQKACSDIGMYSEVAALPADASESEVLSAVAKMNSDDKLDGVIVQLPLPQGIDAQKVTGAILPEKDVDGLHPYNTGRLMHGAPGMTACTPRAVMELIASTGLDLRGKRAVVVGRSSLVGKPLAMLLLGQDATVTMCHSRTENLKEECRAADVLISAAGRPGLITKEHVAPGAVVIDVGTTRVDGRVVGDVCFGDVVETAAWTTPVPGGVGPMTVTMLLANTLDACGA